MFKTIIYPKVNEKTEYIGSNWQGSQPTGICKALDVPCDVKHGQGRIGITGITYTFTRKTGITATPLIAGVDFQYDKRLDASLTQDVVDGFGTIAFGIIDTGLSGDLADGKAFRFIDKSTGVDRNVFSTMGLKVFAKNLTVNPYLTPPIDRIYLDPLTGKYVLPRPVYWSKCNNDNNMLVDADIYSGDITYGKWLTGNVFYTTYGPHQKFTGGTAIEIRDATPDGSKYIALNKSGILKKGAISFYAKRICLTTGTAVGFSYHQFEIASGTYLRLRYTEADGAYAERYYNGTLVDSTAIGNWPDNTWIHVCIQWAEDGSIFGGRNMGMWLNGVYTKGFLKSAHPITVTLNNLKAYSDTSITEPVGITGMYVYIDNIKIWQELIGTPTWEMDKEDAMHTIWGSANNYKPNIVVGYKYLPSLGMSPAILPKPVGVSGPVTDESAADASNGVAYFGASHSVFDTDFTYLKEGEDFAYEEPLDSGTYNIYDTKNSGVLDNGRKLRVCHDSINLRNMGLTPIAKKMVLNNFVPPKNQFYIDPVLGKIITPRPIYWNKCNSFVNTEININNVPVDINGNVTVYSGGKFDDGYYVAYHPVNSTVGSTIRPFGTEQPRKGTMSFWAMVDQGSCDNCVGLVFDKNSANQAIVSVLPSDGGGGSKVDLWIKGGNRQTYWMSFASWVHMYIVWDLDKTLQGNTKTVLVYANGVLILTSDLTFVIDDLRIYFGVYSIGVQGYGLSYIDNIKAWDHVVSESPNFEYNACNGRIDALHEMYGSGNGFRPNLNSIGYYKSSGSGNLVRGKV